MNLDLKITEAIAADEEHRILDLLRRHNLATFGPGNRRELAIPLHDDVHEIVGGLTGYTGRGWLYVAMLYIPENLRGQGLASRMMRMAEDEARSRGCIGAYVDTMNPDALRLYRKLGYTPIGSLNGLAGGHAVTWLQKRFSAGD